MRLKELFWIDVSNRLKNSYVLKTHPSTWKKSEIISFLTHFEEKVTAYRAENNLQPESNVSTSYDTIRRILIKKEYKGSDYTRDLFAQYFGEKSYLDYIQRFDNAETVDIAAKATTKSKMRAYIIGGAGVLIILFGTLYTNYLNSSIAERSECLKIEEAIKGAISSEFAAYKSVPNTDKSIESLKEYFVEDQTAYKKVMRILNNEKIRQWILTNHDNLSSAELLDFDCNYIGEDLASVNTKEHWSINWYDTKIKEYAYLYDTVNIQTYYMRKVNDKWKVAINDYDTNKERVFAKVFNDDDFDASLSVDQVKRKIVEFMARGDNQSALWWLLKYSEQSAPHILQEVILLSGELQNNVRRVNTEEVDISKYHSSNKDIGVKIFELLKQI